MLHRIENEYLFLIDKSCQEWNTENTRNRDLKQLEENTQIRNYACLLSCYE